MPKKAKEETGLLQLDPAIVLADDNTRFNLQPHRVNSLAESIMAQGGVMVPVEVEPIPNGSANGHMYRLTTGFYRHAAIQKLNAEGAGLTLPALVHSTANPMDRLKRQLVENMERENQSPMDQAIAIKKLLDAGIPKIEVRQIFARPGRGKGNQPTPASNSFINMTLSFLDLPKKAQQSIHAGLIGVAAAYQLTKVAPDQREAVMEQIEAARQKAIEAEERDEERWLSSEKKQAEAEEKRATLKKAMEEAEAKFAGAQAALEAATAKATDAFANSKKKYDTIPDKKAASTAFKEAEQVRKVTESDCNAAQAIFEKSHKAYTQQEEVTKDRAEKLAISKTTKPAKGAKDAKVSDKDVQTAAKSAGADSGHVMLNAAEMRKTVAELALPGGNEAVREIGAAFQKCFAGEITDKELYRTLVKIVS
jgi:ParB-like chromosome segregation protein Spo0J